jgi:hypothetical protein
MMGTRIADLTVEELVSVLQKTIHDAVREALVEGMVEPHLQTPLDDFPVDDVGEWPAHLTLRREELYGDDER